MDIKKLLNNGYKLKTYCCGRDKIEWYEKTTSNGYKIEIHNGLANFVNRHWVVRVDDDYCESVGNVDVETIEHVNIFLRLLDIPEKDLIK